ncbi:MAG: methionyl-tRNA formyltransferase [Dehalococcoidales bacterium]
MRIVLFGQAAFGEKTLQALVDSGEEVVGTYTPPDISGRTDPLKTLADRLRIPVFQPGRMRAPAVYDEYTGLKPDLNVMAFVTDIMPESILNHPGYGTIMYHPSLLPRHRGGSAINWAVISGDKKTGVTILWPDKGLDTGPVLLQKEVDISPDDTVGSLYFDKLFPLGIAAILESVRLIKEGVAPRIPQDESLATYEGLCTEKDGLIDWRQPAGKIYNLIRGTNPQPGAATFASEQKFKVFDAAIIPGDTGGAAGEIVDITGDGFVVAATGGAIIIKRVQVKGSPKTGAAEFAARTGLKKGIRLGS